MMKTKRKRNVMNKKTLVLTLVVVFMDQISKMLIESFIALNDMIAIIPNFFNLHHIRNYGAAWSLFESKTIFIIIMSVIGLIVLIRFMFTFKDNTRNSIAFGLVFGGFIGNLVDRGIFGYVRDFLEFHIFGYDYPIFNVADICIVLGVGLLIYAILKGEDQI